MALPNEKILLPAGVTLPTKPAAMNAFASTFEYEPPAVLQLKLPKPSVVSTSPGPPPVMITFALLPSVVLPIGTKPVISPVTGS